MNNSRMNEFIWYHMNGDGDCNGQVLRVYAQKYAPSRQDIFDLAYFYSITYCCASAAILMARRKSIMDNCEAFADEYKNKLVFQSDRKYVRMLDNFYKTLLTWRDGLCKAGEEFYTRNVSCGKVKTKQAIGVAQSWYFFSRFSAYLFVETYCDILGLSAQRETGMKYDGDSMTFAGGLLYVFGLDEEARYVQKRHKLPIDNDSFEYLIRNLQDDVKRAGGDDNFTKLETSLCAYEKFFKGTRYNGYYADRQLGELVKLEREFPAECKAIYEARREAIPVQYRGEDNGWTGIRAELKKGYKNGGEIIGYAG